MPRLALAGVLLAVLPLHAIAGSFRVNTTDDRNDADPGDHRCDLDLAKPGDQCSLRAAAEQLMALPGGEHRILLDGLAPGARLRAEHGTIRLPAGTALLGDPERLLPLMVSVAQGQALFAIQGDGAIRISGLDIRLGSDSGGVLAMHHPSQAAHLADLRITSANPDAPMLRVDAGQLDCLRCRLLDGATSAIEVGGGELRLVDSLLSDNRSDGDGAGLHISAGQVWLQRSEVSRNRSETDGGGIRQTGGELWLVNSLLRGNVANGGGGGLAVSGGVAELQNSSVVGNVANADARGDTGGGGLLGNKDGLILLRNSVVSANRVLATASGAECLGDAIVAEAANLIGDDDACHPRAADNSPPLRSAMPLTAVLRELPWGGVRFMEQPTGAHPAINAGSGHCLADTDLDAATADLPLAQDIRGHPRPPPGAATRCDLGAFQSDCDDACRNRAITDDPTDAATTTVVAPLPDSSLQASPDVRTTQP